MSSIAETSPKRQRGCCLPSRQRGPFPPLLLPSSCHWLCQCLGWLQSTIMSSQLVPVSLDKNLFAAKEHWRSQWHTGRGARAGMVLVVICFVVGLTAMPAAAQEPAAQGTAPVLTVDATLPTDDASAVERVTRRVVRLVVSLPVAVVLLGVGLWLVLPRGSKRGRAFGAVLTLAALGLLAARLRMPLAAGWSYQIVFWVLAAITVISGIGTISMRSPVYCALWFAMALLGTGALMLAVGAQFLGIATVVVYAGAIVVTFLFVLMLAQPQGQSFYDRLSWEPLLSAMTGAVMIFLLSLALESSLGRERPDLTSRVPSQNQREQGVLAADHVAQIGGVLFSRYLVAVEVAGVLLLVAVVGAAVIVGNQRAMAELSMIEQEEGP